MAIIALFLVFKSFATQKPLALFGPVPKDVTYSQFVQDVEQGGIVAEGTFRKDKFIGKYLKNAPGAVKGNDAFEVALPPDSQGQSRADLTRLLNEKKVAYKYAETGVQDALLGAVGPILLIGSVLGLMWFLMMRQAQSGGNQAMNFGRAKPRRPNENVPKVSFDDVAGVEEAKQDLQEIVDFLKNAKKYQALGAKIPKGVLLLGPPGSGKTLLARAIAGEAGVPFFHISGSDFVEMFVGVGASRVRDLFETARQNRPALVFIDEIDAVGRQRGAGWGGGHDEREQTLNQLLVEMDGFDPNSGVILVAATNRPDVLDPALLRPGRFDRRVVVDAPDQTGRKAILSVHTRGKPLADDVNIDSIARRTPGFSGAELANLINEAALLAARKDKTRIDMSDFESAVDRQMMGPERKSRIMSEVVRRRTAVHEAGHAIVGELLANCDPVHKVTILPRGMALGVTISLPTEERYNRTKAEMEDRISMALAGRAAELAVYGDMDTGAVSDLERVTDIARAMVCEYGMSERLGPLRFGKRNGSGFLGRESGGEERDYSEEVAQIIDEEVRGIIERNYARAMEILAENNHVLLRVTEAVMERETVGREEFLALLQDAVVPTNGGRVPQKPEDPEPPNTQVIAPSESEAEGVPSPTRPEPGPTRPRLEPGIA
ncbi:MAG: ATP-dependent metallopeptidase FtsH/Yme1/Tma family protein [Armatimonadetes bacterium]|nr:ATP-dependent metallopeptidase FtsH/Yme1/Tma family protein [Armatimonadota bacterium]